MSKQSIVTSKGLVEYVINGNGTPILFLHGGHSNCQEKLAIQGFDTSKYQLIVPSRPGYGKTAVNNNETPLLAAEQIVELLDLLKIEKVVLYGISAGGLTALAMASTFPERIKCLILASAVTKKWLSTEGKVYKKAKSIFRPGIEKLTWAFVKGLFRTFPSFTANKFYPEFSSCPSVKLIDEDIKKLTNSILLYRSNSGFMLDIEQDLEAQFLHTIKCETLIIHSRNDNSVPYDHALYANQLIKNSKLLSTNNKWGHMIWIGEEANEIQNLILDFISTKS